MKKYLITLIATLSLFFAAIGQAGACLTHNYQPTPPKE